MQGETETAAPRAEREADGTIVFPMEVVAEGLKVPVETLLPGMRAGILYQVTEKGEGEDAGWLRVTFRFRSRQCRLIVEESSGRILPVD
jgi:hypothetical protein